MCSKLPNWFLDGNIKDANMYEEEVLWILF